MECRNKGLWHLGISDEACENAGGQWYRTPCVTLKKTIDERPSRFDLENPLEGTCQDNLGRLNTAFVVASTSHGNFPFETNLHGCHEFCRSLPDYSTQIGMMTTSNGCTCLYQNGKLPSTDLMPSYAKPSPPKFTLTNSDGMALGLRPNIDCDAAAEDLTVETQISDPNNPRQQFEITQDGRIVSVRCPEKVLTTVLGSDGACTEGVGLQLFEYGHTFKYVSHIRYVRVSLYELSEQERVLYGLSSGDKRVLSLSEVQVFSVVDGAETNVARFGTATQSSTLQNSNGFEASKAINGQHTGEMRDITHTLEESNPWWEVALSDSYTITRIVVWNRTTNTNRLSAAVLSLLDASRNVVEEYNLGDTRNKVKFEFDTNGTNEPATDLQRWTFGNNFGTITNVGCPNLAISSSKEKDVSLNSTYFALQNPRTQLAIGTSGDTCSNGMALEMQELVYGSPNQQFIYIENESKIVSLMCPDFAITVPYGDCSTSDGLHLSSDNHNDNRNKWSIDDDVIQSLKCPNKYITIYGALSGRSRTTSYSSNHLIREGSIDERALPVSAHPHQNSIHYVKVSLSGRKRVLSLSEVEVFAGETNVALASAGAKAAQSSTQFNSAHNFGASTAIDGQHTGEQSDITHTKEEKDPWWEVDLSESNTITRIVVWNRDSNRDWLSGAVLSLFDANRNLVEEHNLGENTDQLSFEFDLPNIPNISSNYGHVPNRSGTTVTSRTHENAANLEGGNWDLTEFGSLPGVSANGLSPGVLFSFDIGEWNLYFHISLKPGNGVSQSLDVKQCRNGAEIWRGKVMVYDWSKGRRQNGSANGQWKAKDYVVKPTESCSLPPTSAPSSKPPSSPPTSEPSSKPSSSRPTSAPSSKPSSSPPSEPNEGPATHHRGSLPSSPKENADKKSDTTSYTSITRENTVWQNI